MSELISANEELSRSRVVLEMKCVELEEQRDRWALEERDIKQRMEQMRKELKVCIEKNQREEKQLLKLIDDCLMNKRYFINSGLLEPIHLEINERKQLVEGMWETVEGISEEVYNSQKRFCETFNESCDELVSKLQKTQEFRE